MGRSELLEELAETIARVRLGRPVRVAIDGVDAAGKTTLADELAPSLVRLGRPVIRASIDGFHRPAAYRHRRGDSPRGYYEDSFEEEALLRELLEPLGPGGSRRYRRAVFDFRTDAPIALPPETAAPEAVLLFDGVFLLRPSLRSAWDFSIFVDVAFETAVRRAEVRDQVLFGDAVAVRQRYETRYVPGQRLYLEEADPRARASIVVANDDPDRPEWEVR